MCFVCVIIISHIVIIIGGTACALLSSGVWKKDLPRIDKKKDWAH